MEISNENKFSKFIKKFGAYIGGGFVALGVVIAIVATALSPNEVVPTTTKELVFSVPMTDCEILSEFSDELPIKNTTLGCYKCHLGVDLKSEDNKVYSVLAGTVTDITTDDFEGTTMTIKHDNGFVSVYSSLASETNVKVGDIVESGTLIGTASDSLDTEIATGAHLHLELLKDEVNVDPASYLDIETK